VPGPVWAGDGSVTGSVQTADAVTRTPSKPPPPPRNSTDRV
jgi:hypothetical protein